MPKKSKDPHYDREQSRYDSPVPSREWLLETIQTKRRGMTKNQLFQRFAITDPESQEALRRRLVAMCRDGQLQKDTKGRFTLCSNDGVVEGVVRTKKDGTGWVELEATNDRYSLGRKAMFRLMAGDVVLVRPQSTPYKGQVYADVIRIKQRRSEPLVGRVVESRHGLQLKMLDQSSVQYFD